MNKKFIVVFLIFYACFCNITYSQKPKASVTEGCVPFTVNFTAPAGNTTPYWVLPDTTSSSKTPSYDFKKIGTFKIVYKAFQEALSADTLTIIARPMPVASFTTSPNPPLACKAPLKVTFTNNSTADLQQFYTWKLPDGTKPTTTQLPNSIDFNSIGDFPVTIDLATAVPGCLSTFTRNITVGPPKSVINVPANVCFGVDAPITNGSSAGNYKWTFTNATPTSSTAFEPKVKFTKTGLQTITLKTFSPTDTSCYHEVSTQVFVDNPTVSFTSTPSYSCSEPSIVKYTSTTTTANPIYSWTFEDKSLPNQSKPYNFSTLANPTHTYTIPDSIYTKVGRNVFKTTLVMTAPSGCTHTVTRNDTIHLSWAKFVPNVAKGCSPLKVVFADSSTFNEPITKWTWYYSKGNNPKTNISFTPTVLPEKKYEHTFAPLDTGVFNVRLIIENQKGCKDTSHVVQIQIGEKKTIDFTTDKTSYCTSDSVKFINLTDAQNKLNVDAWHYSNQNNNVSPNQSDNIPHCYTDDNPKWKLNKSNGDQNITLTAEQNGCFSTTSVSKKITISGPTAIISNYTYDCAAKFDINVTHKNLKAAASVNWDFGDGTNFNETSFSKAHTYATTGIYKIVLTAKTTDACPSTKDSVTIEIQDIIADFNLPANAGELCANQPYSFDASPSKGVNAKCYSGYLWEFIDDPNTRPINTANPKENITIKSKGKQNIKLTVEDVNGCKNSITKQVKVYNSNPVITKSIDKICFDKVVTFNNLTKSDTTVTKMVWTFGDKNIQTITSPVKDAELLPVTNNYTKSNGAVDKFLVEFELTDKLGCVSKSSLDLPFYTPISTITNNIGPNFCIGKLVKFTATDFTGGGSNLSFMWDFGDQKPPTAKNSEQNPTYLYDTAGAYPAVLNYTEISSGCKGQAVFTNPSTINLIKMIGLREDGVIGDTITILNGKQDSSYCKEVAPNTIDLIASSKAGRDGTFKWFSNDGGNILSSLVIGNDSTVAIVNATGTYGLEHKSKVGCGIDTAYIYITADTIPTVNLNTTVDITGKKRALVCQTQNAVLSTSFNKSGSYQWYYKDALPDSIFKGPLLLSPTKGSNVVTTINSTSIKTPWVIGDTNTFIVEHFNSCGLARDTLLLEVVPDILSATVTGPVTQCHPITDTLFIETDNTWHSSTIVYWYSNNPTKPAEFIPSFISGNKKGFLLSSVSYPAKYKADVYNSSCGVFTNEVTINPLFKPQNLTITTPDSTLCVGDSTIVSGKYTKASEPVSFRWFKDGVNLNLPTNTSSIPVKLNALDSATYYFSISNLCTESTDDTLSRFLPVVSDTLPFFIIVPRNDTSLCVDGVLDLDYVSYVPYDAYFKLWSTNDRTESIATSMPGLHSLTITSPNLSACKHTENYIIPQCDADIFAPSAFTPDGNYKNDVFFITGKGIIELQFSIFNRWGVKVFETEDINGTWNGKIDGKEAPIGAYVWNAEYKGNFDGTGVVSKSKRGTVLLVR